MSFLENFLAYLKLKVKPISLSLNVRTRMLVSLLGLSLSSGCSETDCSLLLRFLSLQSHPHSSVCLFLSIFLISISWAGSAVVASIIDGHNSFPSRQISAYHHRHRRSQWMDEVSPVPVTWSSGLNNVYLMLSR